MLFTSTILSSFNNTSSSSQQVFAQPTNPYEYNNNNSYDNNNYVPSSYSEYPTDDKKYECRTGPFEGFFVSSVEFCKHIKFDDRKDHDKITNRDNKTGTTRSTKVLKVHKVQQVHKVQGQGLPGANGTNGINGTNGVNGTDFNPCVACLLDALAKLDSGAILVNVTVVNFTDIIRPSIPGTPPLPIPENITVPLVIDVDVALLLQQQLAVDLGLDANATIFEICTAIDAQGLDIEAIINSLEVDLEPIVLGQINQLVNQIVIAIETITGNTIDPALIDEILANIDIDAIVAQITANVQV